jgi:uncharacterized SAM-binding protein YcdF (DUF218 family)
LKQRVGLAFLFLAIAVALLSGPLASWMRYAERRPPRGLRPDAIYLAAGGSEQSRRVAAATSYARRAWDGAPPIGALILTANDPSKSRWSRADQRNLSTVEWTVHKLQEEWRAAAGGVAPVAVVPGRPRGTDEEMAALADWFRAHSGIRAVVLVTSPFHVRRCVGRLEAHAPAGIRVYAVAPPPTWRDRRPWTVAAELLKMARDGMGLSRAPLLTRR